MSNTTFSQVIINSREQILSGDLNRIQKIASREAADRIVHAMKRDEFTDATGAPCQLPTLMQLPIPENCADAMGTPTYSVGSYQCGVTAGQAYTYNIPSTTDESGCVVVRWPATSFTITPHATLQRIDIIIATPAMVDTDAASRNILVDPVARTVSPNIVNKTTNPEATVTVLTGTPGGTKAPSVPAGSLGLWEVIVPTTAADSSEFLFVPRTWRRLESFGTSHMIIEGAQLKSANSIEGVPGIGPPYFDSYITRVAIDGEVIVALIPGTVSGAHFPANSDENADPYGLTVQTWDQPVFLYLCGGHWAPMNGCDSTIAVVGKVVQNGPLVLMASITPPLFGRASADLKLNGDTIDRKGTLYAGVAFMAAGYIDYKPTYWAGDWVYAKSASSVSTVLPTAGFRTEGVKTGAAGALTITCPISSTAAEIAFQTGDASANGEAWLFPGNTYSDDQLVVSRTNFLTGMVAMDRTRVEIPSLGQFNWKYANATTNVRLFATGFNMNVSRLG
jgi:hypothetical protein